MSPELAAYVIVRDTAKQLFCSELGTLYRALSAEASTSYGLSPIFTVHDELGQVKGPRSELYEALETASGAQEAPLSIVISTQAPTDADLLSLLIDDAKRGTDPRIKLFMFSAPETLDPFSDKALKAANPALGDFLNASEVRAQAEDARRMPSRESSFRNLILNQRVSQRSPFIPRAIWEACGGEPDEDAFRTGPVYMGLDLSARNDLTALAMVAKGDDGVWNARVEFFAPLSGLVDRAHRDRAPYDLWEQQGFLTATPGSSVDYAVVAERMIAICDEYHVDGIAFDRWRIDVLLAELNRLHVELPVHPFGQGFKDMSPALDAIESVMMNGKLRHGNNPLLTWCASNAIAVRDPAENRKLDKSKSSARIDGLVALTMAMGRATVQQNEGSSFWETMNVDTRPTTVA
jgi:phage terminase large subunit-like protein